MKAELIYKNTLEHILETGRGWGWGEDFWAVKYAREAIELAELLNKEQEAEVSDTTKAQLIIKS